MSLIWTKAWKHVCQNFYTHMNLTMLTVYSSRQHMTIMTTCLNVLLLFFIWYLNWGLQSYVPFLKLLYMYTLPHLLWHSRDEVYLWHSVIALVVKQVITNKITHSCWEDVCICVWFNSEKGRVTRGNPPWQKKLMSVNMCSLKVNHCVSFLLLCRV